MSDTDVETDLPTNSFQDFDLDSRYSVGVQISQPLKL